MVTPKGGEFCKKAICPSSKELADFQSGKECDRVRDICAHLSVCEFCRAEVEFYAHYPLKDEKPCPPEKIPDSLFELAKALLGTGRERISMLKNLLRDQRISRNNGR